MIWDERLVDAWRREKFSGLAFEPLQAPLKNERNFPSLGRAYWESSVFREAARGGVTYEKALKLVRSA